VMVDGKTAWQPRSAEELARIATLVRGAIGYDEKRGDHVDVVSMRFATGDDGPAAERGGVLGVKLEKADLMRLAETLLFGLIALLGLLLVLRPMVLRLTTPQPALPGSAAALASGVSAASLPGGSALALGGSGAAAALGGPGVAGLLEDESMMNIANIEGQMRASSLRRIAGLVEKHPEETLAIVRGWMAEEPA
jgi:flagellar M-ring protein FliF